MRRTFCGVTHLRSSVTSSPRAAASSRRSFLQPTSTTGMLRPQISCTSGDHLYVQFSSESGVSILNAIRMMWDFEYDRGRKRCKGTPGQSGPLQTPTGPTSYSSCPAVSHNANCTRLPSNLPPPKIPVSSVTADKDSTVHRISAT